MAGDDIARRRLTNQRLIGAPFGSAKEAVRYLTAVQSQDYAGAKWGVGQRLTAESVVDSDIDVPFNAGRILRTHVMRPTWHFVVPEDIRWLLKLTRARVRMLMATYDKRLELEAEDFVKANRALTDALAGGKHLTRAEATRVYESAGYAGTGQRIGHLLMWAEIEGLICSGAIRGKQQTYALLEERVPPAPELTREESLAELTRRYFRGHGPAMEADFAWWSGLTLSDVRAGIASVREDLVSEQVDRKTYWSLPDVEAASYTPPRLHLLPNYDEYLIAYKDRTAFLSPDQTPSRQVVYDVLYRHVIVLNGRVAGGWRPVVVRKVVQIEAKLLAGLSVEEREAVESEASRYGRFVGMRVEVTFRLFG